MTYSFHPAAQSEFEQAALYYFEKNLSLASAFYNEVAFAIEGIVENPFLPSCTAAENHRIGSTGLPINS